MKNRQADGVGTDAFRFGELVNIGSMGALMLVSTGMIGRSVRPIRAEPKPGRNEDCPCGSNRKYKHCCGLA
jgi:hypothetical protein